MAVGDPPLPEAAIRWLGSQGLRPSEHWTDVWGEEHGLAFTVARMSRLDMLGDVQGALVRALRDGTPMRQFVAEMEPRLARMGWAPPAGRGGDVPTRLARIYETNVRTARAAGQWDRIQRAKDAQPYLLYMLGGSLEHREQHLAWEGTLLPVDHQFWTWAMPPGGFGCKCHVRQMSEDEADRLARDGITLRNQRVRDPTTGEITREDRHVTVRRNAPRREMIDWTNPATGEVRRITRGIDPGFDYNAGMARPEGVRAAFSAHIERWADVVCDPE